MERVLGASTVSGRVGERADGLEQLDDRAWPSVRHDQRQGVLVGRADVDKVDVDPVDLGRELRQPVQPRLDAPEVVVGRPVARQRLQSRQLHALRAIFDELLAGPACRRNAAAQLYEFLLRDLDVEGAYLASLAGGLDDAAHDDLRFLVGRGSADPSSGVGELAVGVPQVRTLLS